MNTIKAVAILENPCAGSGKSAEIAIKLSNELIIKGIPATVYSINWPNDFDDYSDIWLIGGDGTISYFINKYPFCDKNIAIFKGGTGNDFAWKLYGDINLKQQIHQVLNSKPKMVDIVKFNNILFINCLGVGFDGETIQSMDSIRFLGGHIGYLVSVIRTIFTFKEYRFVIKSNGETWDDQFLLVMIANSSRAGGGFFIAPQAQINDGLLNMVLCKKLSVFNRLKYLPLIQKGKHLNKPFVIHQSSTDFTIFCEKQMAIQFDGELTFANELKIGLHSHAFKFRY